jgi:hypothetical protein
MSPSHYYMILSKMHAMTHCTKERLPATSLATRLNYH